MTKRAESEGKIYRSPREPEHVIPSPFDRRVVVIRPRQRLSMGLIGNDWRRIVEIIELGRQRAREVLFAGLLAGLAEADPFGVSLHRASIQASSRSSRSSSSQA